MNMSVKNVTIVLNTWLFPLATLTPDAPSARLKKSKSSCLPDACGPEGLPPVPADLNSRPVHRPVAEVFKQFPWQGNFIITKENQQREVSVEM
jgi:hypothetical protein